jgi:alanine racemase
MTTNTLTSPPPPSNLVPAAMPLTWVEIDCDALCANLAAFRRRVGPRVRLCPVVKANAYGHGAALVGRVTAAAGADFLAVATLDEAEELRRAGLKLPLLVLGYVALADLPAAVAAGFHLTVYNLETLDALERAADKARLRVPVHLKIETGTQRQGILARDLPRFAERLRCSRSLVAAGASSHFANIEDTTSHDYARAQEKRFHRALARLESLGLRPGLRHIASSAATILFRPTHLDLVRLGISLYGHWPSRETQVSAAAWPAPRLGLRPVLTMKTRVVQIKQVPAGAFVGYGCTYRTSRRSRLAVLPVGYWDGYDRGLSNLGHVLVGGQRAPIRGRVCMNLTMVDVTDIDRVSLEDEVVLIGTQGEESVGAEQLASWLGTISYEVLTRLNPLIPRLPVGRAAHLAAAAPARPTRPRRAAARTAARRQPGR